MSLFSMASFLNRLAVHRTVLASFLLPVVGLPVFGLAPGVLASHCSGSPGAVSFLPDDAEVACRASFSNVSADPIGLISVPVNTALLLVILRPVVMQDSSKANPLRGGDAEPPVPGQADSSMSPQRPLGLKCLCEPPACNPHGSVWTPAAVVRDCGHARG